jgi:ADP-dependent NAD(P)H-hydrate dehydratase
MRRGSVRITENLLRRWPLPELDGKSGKEDRGCALVVGGSAETPGAVLLAAIGALRAGAGRLQIATNREIATSMALAIPEARVIGLKSRHNGAIGLRSCRKIFSEVARCDALLLGPGMIDGRAAFELFHCPRQNGATLVIDAGALQFFRGRSALPSASRGAAIATPHAGEMANLWGIERDEVRRDALEVARAAAALTGAVIALKGACTYIAAPDGTTFHNTEGNLGLGTSGSGDALSGIIAGLAARGADPLQAAAWGVFLHAKAGDVLARKMGMLGFLARELLTEIPPLMASLPRLAPASHAARPPRNRRTQ